MASIVFDTLRRSIAIGETVGKKLPKLRSDLSFFRIRLSLMSNRPGNKDSDGAPRMLSELIRNLKPSPLKNDLQLVYFVFSSKQGLPRKHFSKDTPNGP